MFGSNKKKLNAGIDTLIGSGTEIYGNVHFSDGLHIDGEIVGNVVAKDEASTLTISESGRIEGNIKVHFIELRGEVVGDVYALEEVELTATAHVKGNVFYNKIELVKGAKVNGSLIHGDPREETDKGQSIAAAPKLKSDLEKSKPVDGVVKTATVAKAIETSPIDNRPEVNSAPAVSA